MKFFVIDLLLLFAVLAPSHAQSAEKASRVLMFEENIKKFISASDNLKMCGDYFAAGETTKERVIFFTFEKMVFHKPSRVFVFGPVDRVVVSIDNGAATPVVTIRGTRALLRMNDADYKAGLPCLAKGGVGI